METPANAYFRSGTFSTEDIIAFWGQGIHKAKDTGTSGQLPHLMAVDDAVYGSRPSSKRIG